MAVKPMDSTLSQLGLYGIIPVLVLNDPRDGPLVAEALSGGGLPCVEVTFRSAAAAEAIAAITGRYPAMTVGAGTILTTDQARAAIGAGARFLVAPGVNRKVLEFCLAQRVTVLPGVATPSDIEICLEYGLEAVKFFPAEAQGGVEYLKAISAPYGRLCYVPTGGIAPANLLSYLTLPHVLACGGSWMVRPELVVARRFDEIRRLAEEAIRLMLGLELRHITVNGKSEQEAQKNAERLASLLALPVRNDTESLWVGTHFEITRPKFPGTHGGLAIGTHFPLRARAYLERRGFGFRPETAVEKDGELLAISLQEEIGGFAVQLVQR
ncbi:MAG TPA: bifunctional 4-hydroxy-2-oxoglutarate aldolase/2-dehydro-3-deoxy-phosphogluconate aldolase [Bacteroidota bacterium]|nr:bifunctional 4-hydroxy-2-oxoglutarate aldolase/2-dehydro-3-deoxy-phosphogluconate aldolase [Bacteroidota bacterium]